MEAVGLCQGHDQQGCRGLTLDVHLFGVYSGGGLVTQSCLTLVTPWIVARQAPVSMGDFRREYWSGLPFRSPISKKSHYIKQKTNTQYGKISL